MPTQQQILNLILTAQLKTATLTDANIIALQGGAFKVNWGLIRQGTRAINAVSRQYYLLDYSSSKFLDAFSCLSDFVGIYGAGSIDPNAQVPGTTIITLSVLQNYNDDKLAFSTTNLSPQLILANYDLNYLPLYGNNPDISLQVTSGSGFSGEEQTPPQYTYAIPGDETSNITQILYDFPIGTSGYVRIAGIGSQSSGTPTGGGGTTPITFTYSQSDLVYDSSLDQYYLPLVLPGTKKPYYASLNGVSLPLNYDANTGRFNGFANNLPTQVIQISLM